MIRTGCRAKPRRWERCRAAQVTINDTAPTTDHWDLSLIEIVPGVPDTTPPTAPTKLAANAVNSNQVNVMWTASTDNMGVTGYNVVRNGAADWHDDSATAGYTDVTVAPNTTYTYTAHGLRRRRQRVGSVSNPSTVSTTPPASVNPPVISNISVSRHSPRRRPP